MAPQALRRRRAAAQLLQPGRRAPRRWRSSGRCSPSKHRTCAPPGWRCAPARRSLSAAAVDAALTRERSLVVAWLARGTLHLVAAEDHGWLLGLTAPRRRRARAGAWHSSASRPDQAERAVDVIARALADDGPQTRAELAAQLEDAAVSRPRARRFRTCSPSPRGGA
jgi:hypothetical protein